MSNDWLTILLWGCWLVFQSWRLSEQQLSRYKPHQLILLPFFNLSWLHTNMCLNFHDAEIYYLHTKRYESELQSYCVINFRIPHISNISLFNSNTKLKYLIINKIQIIIVYFTVSCSYSTWKILNIYRCFASVLVRLIPLTLL